MTFANLGLLVLVVLASSVGLADEVADNDIKAAEQRNIAEETSVLASCERTTCPVFYVAALGGMFPIPTRFFLVSKPGEGDTLEFHSSVSAMLKGAMTRETLLNELLGSIHIGTNGNLRQMMSSGGYKVTATENRGGVTILALRLAHQPELLENFAPMRIIKGKDDYVQIIDQNPNLVDLLMRIYERDNSVAGR